MNKTNKYQTGGPTVSQFDYTQKAAKPLSGSNIDSSGRKTLKRGSKGDEVTLLQTFLKNKNLYSGKVDGNFGPQTEAAVKDYQEWYNKNSKYSVSATTKKGHEVLKAVTVDGIVGDQTRAALMYRDQNPALSSPKQKQQELVPGAEQRVNKFKAEDSHIAGEPDGINFQGGLEMMGLAALGVGVGAAVDAIGSTASMANVTRNVVQAGKNIPKAIKPKPTLNPTVPKGAPQMPGGRYFGPKTPSGYGTRVGYVTGGDIGQMMSMAAPMLSMIPGAQPFAPILGMAGSALSAQPTNKSNVISASPGKYMVGGELLSYLYQGPQNPVQGVPTQPMVTQPMVQESTNAHIIPAALPRDIDGYQTNMQVRKTMNYPTGAKYVQDDVRIGKKSKVPMPREQATGGDLPLSNEAFQVKGNSGVTDGNYYPQYNAKLDHNEVVKTQQDGTPFVYSTKLKDPMTNKPFSHLAAKAEGAKGKAEKMLKHNPYDEQAKSTISHSNNTLESLAGAQERLAAYLGHRNPDGSTVQKAATGGMLGYATGGPWDGFDTKAFQEWANKNGAKLTVDGKMGPKTQAMLTQLQDPYASYLNMAKGVDGKYSRQPITLNPTGGFSARTGDDTYASYDPKGLFGQPLLKQAVIPSQDMQMLPTGQKGYSMNMNIPGAAGNMITGAGAPNISYAPNSQTAAAQQANTTARLNAISTNASAATTRDPNVDPNSTDPNKPYETPWTVGDNLKVVELLGKTIGAFGPSERERQMTDNTQITKQVYDPRQAVYQNQRNFQNTVNTTSTPSINLRRGLINSALSNTMNANSNVLTQYQQMNQQANSTYEDRLANQRRFNIESMFRTNDMNAQNRAAKDMVQQNMFSSVGQFGEDLNRKRYAADAVNLLARQYPDVYKGVFKTN